MISDHIKSFIWLQDIADIHLNEAISCPDKLPSCFYM
jgi:hypothetical protein